MHVYAKKEYHLQDFLKQGWNFDDGELPRVNKQVILFFLPTQMFISAFSQPHRFESRAINLFSSISETGITELLGISSPSNQFPWSGAATPWPIPRHLRLQKVMKSKASNERMKGSNWVPTISCWPCPLQGWQITKNVILGTELHHNRAARQKESIQCLNTATWATVKPSTSHNLTAMMDAYTRSMNAASPKPPKSTALVLIVSDSHEL